MNSNGGNLEDRMTVAERLIAALFDSHEKTQEELRTVARSQVLMSDAQRKTEEALRATDLKLAELADKLNAVINLMDLHLKDHRERRT